MCRVSKAWLLGAGVLAAGLALAWGVRRPIGTAAVRSYLANNGVAASYRLVEADNRRLIFDNLVLGPAARPELQARRLEVTLGWTRLSPVVTAVRIDGLRLRMQGASFGSLDRLIPATQSVRFPAIAVDVRDGRVDAATPYGTVTALVSGAGRLDRDFRGFVDILPADLRDGDCRGRLAARAVVTTKGADFAVSHRGQVTGLACAGVTVPRLALSGQGAAPITLARLSGDLTLGAARAAMNAGRSGAVTARLAVAGTPARLRGDWRMTAAGLSQGADRLGALSGNGRLTWAAKPGLAVVGGLEWRDLQLAAVTRRQVSHPMAARALAAARRIDGDGTFALEYGAITEVRVSQAELRGGGAILSFGDGNATWSGDRIVVNGLLGLAGGGLPDARLVLNVERGAPGWRGDGRLVMADWRVGTDRVAVPGLAFRLEDDRVAVNGRVLASGGVGQSRVDGLDLRLNGFGTFSGGFGLGPGCADIAVDGARFGGNSIGRLATRLCPVAGAAPMLADGRLRGGLIVDPLRLAGADYAVATERARIDLSGTLAQPVVATSGLALAGSYGDYTGGGTIAGRLSAAGGAGRITRGAADVPGLRLRAGTAGWRLADSRLALTDVAAAIDDGDPRPLYKPLRLAGGAATLAADAVTATGQLRLAAGDVPLATVSARYDPVAGTGSAVVDSTLAFGPDLQPESLSERARGFVANVEGAVVSHADLTFGAKGVGGTAQVKIDNVSLATAALGPVTGISGTIAFDDLPRLHTPPAQRLTIAGINPGVLVADGTAQFQLVDATTVNLESLHWPFAGGNLTLAPVVIRGGDTRRRFVMVVDGLEAAEFLQRFELKNLNASGRFDGVLPLVFDGGVGRIEGGRLTARAEGGTIQYVGEVGQDSMGAAARLAFDALRRLRYRSLTLALDGDLDGELVTAIDFTGTNEAPVQLGGGFPLRASGVPFKFGVTVRAPFRALLGNFASFSDARSVLRAAAVPVVPEPVP